MSRHDEEWTIFSKEIDVRGRKGRAFHGSSVFQVIAASAVECTAEGSPMRGRLSRREPAFPIETCPRIHCFLAFLITTNLYPA